MFTKGMMLLLIPLVNLLYTPLNHDNGRVHSFVTSFDKLIPFSRYFVIPYIGWYVLIFATMLWILFKNTKLYFTSLTAIVIGLLISFGVYSVFQTTVPRPVVSGQDFLSRLIRGVYALDNPYNAFPSIHVMTSSILWLVSSRARSYSKKITLLIKVLVIIIISSTLFLKQHTLLDVAGGIVLGGLVFSAVEKFSPIYLNRPAVKGSRFYQPVSEITQLLAKERQSGFIPELSNRS